MDMQKSDNKETKVIIFDIGGVLVDLDMAQCVRRCKEELGFDRIEEFLDPCHQKGFFRKFEAGEISLEDFRKMVLAMCRPGVKPEDADRAFSGLVTGIAPYKIPLLKDLASMYELYALSNNNAASMPYCYKLFEQQGLPMKSVFRKLYLSYELRMLKPHDDIFQYTIADISKLYSESHPLSTAIGPQNMLYIDDSASNVEAAAANGLNAVLYVPGSNLKEAIDSALY